MRLTVDINKTRVSEATDEERMFLSDYLAFENKGAAFVARKMGWKESKIRLFDLRSNTFPSGLLPMVIKACTEEGHEIDLIDQRRAAAEPLSTDLSWLYDYQLAAVRAALRHKRGIIQIPTGGGKTECIVGLVKSVPIKWLFVANRTKLARQAAERYHLRTGEHAGVIAEGEWREDERFTVATLQSLRKALESTEGKRTLASFGGLLFDECHVAPAESYAKIVSEMRHAYYRIGFSATPLDRSDEKSVVAIAHLGPVVFKIPVQILIERGVLAKPLIRFLRFNHPKYDAAIWTTAYSKGIVSSKQRNDLVAKIVHASDKPCFVFVKQVGHGKALKKLLSSCGIPSELVWGEKDEQARDRSLKRLMDGDVQVLICSVVFQEGIDVPGLASVINASGMSSKIAALQKIGRGMRSDGGRKTTFEVWDIDDRGDKFLQRHAQERKKTFKDEGHEILPYDFPQ